MNEAVRSLNMNDLITIDSIRSFLKFLFFSLYEDTRLNIKYEYARFLYKI